MIHYHISNLSLHITGFITIQVDVKSGKDLLWKKSLFLKCNGTQFEQLFGNWDGRKLIEIFPEAVQFFDELDSRLDRYNSTSIVEPLIFSEGEFIEVDRHSSFNGNHKLNGKEGCCANIIENEREDLTLYEPFDFQSGWSAYDLPAICGMGHYQKWTTSEKSNYFKTLPVEVRRTLIDRQLSNLKVSLQENKPFEVHLSGTDDDSWTKYFDTHQECLDELTYLRKMQPINKEMDVINRGYIFTN